MFRALGLILVLWFLSSTFTGSFSAVDTAFIATMHTIETAAEISEVNLNKLK